MKLFWALFTAMGLCCGAARAQQILQAFTPTALYAAPELGARTIGLFARGGVIFNPRPAVEAGWLQAQAEDGTTGFVRAEYFRKTLNARDTFAPDPAPIIPGGDGIWGGPHLFVRAASVKGRSAPSAAASARKIYHVNDPVSVHYLPHNPDGWVRVEGHFANDEATYIQRKFLGPRLRPDSVLGVYDALPKSDLAARRSWAERFLELAWKEDLTTRIAALERFIALAKETGDEAAATRAGFELRMTRAMQNPLSPEELAKPAIARTLRYELGGYASNGSIPYAQLSRIRGGHKTRRDSLPECGAEADARILFPTLALWGMDDSQMAYLDWIDLSAPGNSVSYAGFRIHASTREEEFVQALGRYFSVRWTEEPHVYYFGVGEGQAFLITFRDGKPLRYEEIYYC